MWSRTITSIRLKALLKGGEIRKQGLLSSFAGNQLVLLHAIHRYSLGDSLQDILLSTSLAIPSALHVSAIIVNREQSKKKRAYPEV